MNSNPRNIDAPQKAANLIVEGIRPSQIAKNLGISPAELEPVLARAVMLGRIRRSDILFTFPQSLCETVEGLSSPRRSPVKIFKSLQIIGEDVDESEVGFLCAFIEQRVVYSDLYDMISIVESSLHKRIRECLWEEFPRPEDAWWRKGVPLPVRQACGDKKEADENPSDDPYTYTTLIDLKAIIEGKNKWNIFSKRLPKGAQDKPQLLNNLGKLNSIRNRVMHPVRLDDPPGETEYRFVSQMHNTLVTSPWNLRTDIKGKSS